MRRVFGCIVAVGAIWFVQSLANSEIAAQSHDRGTLEAVALLFYGPYGERPYKLTIIAEGALALEEVDGGPVRFVLRRIPGKPCIFLAIHDDSNGLNIERLDFTRFDGSNQLLEACGPKGTFLESNCTSSLHFKSDRGYCQYIFRDPQFGLTDIPFPEEACRPFGIGAREKNRYAKYVQAFDFAFRQCGRSLNCRSLN